MKTVVLRLFPCILISHYGIYFAIYLTQEDITTCFKEVKTNYMDEYINMVVSANDWRYVRDKSKVTCVM